MENDLDRRIMVAWIRPEVFASMFGAGAGYCVAWQGIPDGAKLRNVVFDYTRDAFGFYLRHPSFRPVAAGEEIPVLDAAYCRVAAVPTYPDHARAA